MSSSGAVRKGEPVTHSQDMAAGAEGDAGFSCVNRGQGLGGNNIPHPGLKSHPAPPEWKLLVGRTSVCTQEGRT